MEKTGYKIICGAPASLAVKGLMMMTMMMPTFIDGFLSHRLFQVRAGSTLSDTHEREMGVSQGSILSPVLFSLKISHIVKSVLKGSDASLLVDDFAICIRAKSLSHAKRLMQLGVNSVQEWVSNNMFKSSTSKLVSMHFCNQRKQFAEPSIMLEKYPIKSSDRSHISWCGIWSNLIIYKSW